MEPGFTPTLKTNILRYFFNITPETVPAPSQMFAGLFVSQGGPEANELIIGDGSYARAPVDFMESDGIIKNVSSITFPRADADWTSNSERLTHLGIFTSHIDDATGEWVSNTQDTLIAFLPLQEPESVQTGQTFQLNPQAVKLQLV